jgi:hypothetical protein
MLAVDPQAGRFLEPHLCLGKQRPAARRMLRVAVAEMKYRGAAFFDQAHFVNILPHAEISFSSVEHRHAKPSL